MPARDHAGRWVETGYHQATLLAVVRHAERVGKHDEAATARWLAALRRDRQTASAWPASLIHASRWPDHSRVRRMFVHELLELVEATIGVDPFRLIHLLLGPDRTRFVDEARDGDPDRVVRLIVDAGTPPGEAPVDVGEHDLHAMRRALNNDACGPLAAPLARLLAVARWRARTFPLGARTRGVLVDGDRGVVVTLAARVADGGEGARLTFPACAHPDVAAAIQAAWEQAGVPWPVELRLLDHAAPFEGPSLGLAALISCSNLLVAGRDPSDVAAIGGSARSPFTPTPDRLEVKLAALREWMGCHRDGVRTLALAAADQLPTPTDWIDRCVLATNLDDVRHGLLAAPAELDELRRRWTHALPGPERPTVRRMRAEWSLQRFLPGQALVLITGEPNIGKSTFGRDLARAWNQTDGSGRTARFTDLTGVGDLLAAATALARDLRLDPRPEDDLRIVLSAIVGTWERLSSTEQLVWIVDGIDPVLASMAAGALVDDVQRAQAGRAGRFCLVGIVAGSADWLDARIPPTVPRVELDLFNDDELGQLAGDVAAAGLRELLRHPWAWSDSIAGNAVAWAARLERGELAPLGFLQDFIHARLDEADRLPGALTLLHAGLAAMAADATMSFAADPARAPALVATGFLTPVTGDRVRFREGLLLEQALAAELAMRDVLDGGWLSDWLDRARQAPASDQPVLENALVMALVRRAVLRTHLADPARLRKLFESRDPHVVLAAARAELTSPSWSSPAARQSFEPATIWTLVRRAFARSSPDARRVLLRLGSMPGSDTLVADGLIDADDRVHHVACTALQRRVRGASRADEPAEHALAPLFLAPASGWRPIKILTSSIVAFAEAGRTGSLDFLTACKRTILHALAEAQRRSWLLRRLRSRTVRRGLFGTAARLAWFWLRSARSHNPMRNLSEVTGHFEVAIEERRRFLGPFIAFMQRDPGGGDELVRLEALTRSAHATPGLAFAPANWVIESAWGTLAAPADADELLARAAALAELFRTDLEHVDRYPYAQSCLFILFRQLWSAPDTLRDAAFKALSIFERLVATWVDTTLGAYTTPAGNEMRILHLFRLAGISRRLRGDAGDGFAAALRSYPALTEALVEETMHLAYELEEWPLAMSLLEEIARAPRTPDDRRRVGRAIARAQEEVADRRPDISSSRATGFLHLQRHEARLEPPAGDRTPALPPMTGISLAFEELTYVLLRSSPRFRTRWARWMAGCVDGTSVSAWFASVFELAYELVFTPEPS